MFHVPRHSLCSHGGFFILIIISLNLTSMVIYYRSNQKQCPAYIHLLYNYPEPINIPPLPLFFVVCCVKNKNKIIISCLGTTQNNIYFEKVCAQLCNNNFNLIYVFFVLFSALYILLQFFFFFLVYPLNIFLDRYANFIHIYLYIIDLYIL